MVKNITYSLSKHYKIKTLSLLLGEVTCKQILTFYYFKATNNCDHIHLVIKTKSTLFEKSTITYN